MPIFVEKPSTVEKAEINIARDRRAGLVGKLLLATVDRRPLANSYQLVERREKIGAAGRLQEDINHIIRQSQVLPDLFYSKYGSEDITADMVDDPTYTTHGRVVRHFTESAIANPHAPSPRMSTVFNKPLALYLVNNLYERASSTPSDYTANAYCYAEYNVGTYIVMLNGDHDAKDYEVVASLPLNRHTVSRMSDTNPAIPSEGYLEAVVADDMAQVQTYVDSYR